MRLEGGDQPPIRKRLARGRQRGAQLGGVMGVVIHDRDTGDLSQPVEAAPHAPKVRERRERRRGIATERHHDAQGRGGIAQVVHTGDLQLERDGFPPREGDGRAGP